MICDLATYRRLTKDTDSIDGDVTLALTAAQETLERLCSRHFERGTYTETMRLFATGRVYPKAFPIVSAPDGVVDGASLILGFGYQYAEGINPFVSGFGAGTTAYQPQVTITYTGGYLSTEMPAEIVRAVAALAYTSLHTTVMAGVPSGANNVRLGDLAVSGSELSGLDDMTPYVRRVIRRYRRPMVEAF